MSTPAPPPSNLGEQFTRKPKVYVDQPDVGKVMVTGPASKEHPGGWGGAGIREGGRWLVEDQDGDHVGKARSAKQVGHVLAKHHGHAKDTYDVAYQRERFDQY